MFEKPNIKFKKIDANKLLIDFNSNEIPKPNSNDIIIEPVKVKEEIVKPTIKVKSFKKGKSLI